MVVVVVVVVVVVCAAACHSPRCGMRGVRRCTLCRFTTHLAAFSATVAQHSIRPLLLSTCLLVITLRWGYTVGT
jgi:hypothetical protein